MFLDVSIHTSSNSYFMNLLPIYVQNLHKDSLISERSRCKRGYDDEAA
jgi:hypothetical protein